MVFRVGVEGLQGPEMVENPTHPCNFDLECIDTRLLGFVRHSRRDSAKRANPHAYWRLSCPGHL
jgi:hypothetical protein